jgi:hypothetical protein
MKMRLVVLAALISMVALVTPAQANVCETRVDKIVSSTGSDIYERSSTSISVVYRGPAVIGVIVVDCDPDNDRVISSAVTSAYPPSADFWTLAGVALSIAMDSSTLYVEAGGRDCFNRASSVKEGSDGYRVVGAFARLKFDFSCSMSKKIFTVRISEPKRPLE